jgi:hypothetical protein
MAQSSSRFLWIAAMVVLVSAIVLVAAERRQPRPVTTAYFSDSEVQVQPFLEKGAGTFSYGPWMLGSIVPGDKASDHRFNVYIIAPGIQHQAPAPADEFNNAVLINAAEDSGDKVPEWDVFWVVVLDPELNQDIRNERELLLLGQADFVPNDLYQPDDAPGHNLLRQLGILSINDLARFRRDDGALPRVILLSAGTAVRMKVTPPPPAESH